MIDVKVFNKSKNELPKYAKEGDSGVDLYADEAMIIFPHSSALIQTNIHVAIPQGYEIQIRSRSGLAYKHDIFVLNSPGTIDSGYRNSIGVLLYNAGTKNFEVEEGMRIAQAVLCPVEQINFIVVDSLDDSDRGQGGFGSTGV